MLGQSISYPKRKERSKTMPDTIGINVERDFDIPRVPNFLIASRRGDAKISIADVSEEQLKALGEAWTLRLINRAREIRTDR